MSVPVLRVAKTLGELSGFTLSNLQMQKIVYIAEMLFLGRHGTSLVRESFEAWDYGPVCPALYHWGKMFGTKPVKDIFSRVDALAGGTPEYEAVEEAFNLMRKFTPGQMVNVTHQSDGAWAKNYRAGQRGTPIPTTDIAAEYEVRINED